MDNLLNQKENGFYIEAGAYDGERCSNTIFFEMNRNWSGILIEVHIADAGVLDFTPFGFNHLG